MNDKRYMIGELAEMADTTVRTIRFYTDEGLLPQPVLDGKFAIYTHSHIIRLQLIRRLKDAYLPLREIRLVLNSMDDAVVEAKLKEPALLNENQKIYDLNVHEQSPNPSEALDYIRHVMREQENWRTQLHQKSAPAPHVSQQKKTDNSSKMQTSNIGIDAGQSWQRIELAHGVEMNVKLPANQKTFYRIEQLIALAKKLFQP